MAALIAVPPALAQDEPPPFKSPFKTIDGGDDDWFMEETTPKKPKQVNPAKIPNGLPNNVGVPMTEDGRIIPLKDDGSPVMQQGSQLEVTNEYVYQPGAYYPGISQWNTPYMGGLNPYYAPGMVPYGYGYNPGGININLGRAGGISLGGAAYPYTQGYNTSTYRSFGMPNSSVIINPNAGFINPGFVPGYGVPGYGYGVPGMYTPGINIGVPGVGGIGVPGVGGIGLPSTGGIRFGR